MIIKSKWVYATMVVALSIGLFGLLTGCPDNGVGATAEDGTITLRVINAGAHNTAPVFCAIGAKGADLDDPANWLGEGDEPIITLGVAETLFYEIADTSPVTFTGGESYDIGVLIDANKDDIYTSVLDYVLSSVRTVVVDGDMVVEVDYLTDFIPAP
jgi:hypothetical protein